MRTLFLSVEQEALCVDSYNIDEKSKNTFHHDYISISSVPFGQEDADKNRPCLIGPIHENYSHDAFVETKNFLTKLGYNVVDMDNAKGEWVGGGLYVPHPSEINNSTYSVRLRNDVWEVVQTTGDEEKVMAYASCDHFANAIAASLNQPMPEIILFTINNKVKQILGNREINPITVVYDETLEDSVNLRVAANETHTHAVWNDLTHQKGSIDVKVFRGQKYDWTHELAVMIDDLPGHTLEEKHAIFCEYNIMGLEAFQVAVERGRKEAKKKNQ